MFDTWSHRVEAAADADAQRALLSEIAVARARSLGDLGATRDATWALARLHQALGERGKAKSEAEQLVSLCQTPPAASKAAQRGAAQLLEGLGGKAPSFPKAERKPRKERGERGERKDRERGTKARKSDDPVGSAREAAGEGKTRKVRSMAGDRRGPTWSGFRAWALLTDARTAGKGLEQAVDKALAELAGGLGIPAPAAADPLSERLGEALPTKRRARLAKLEAFVASHPEQLDALVVEALEHHLATQGSASAGWLSGLVGHALAAGGEGVKATLQAHAQAPGLKLYDAWAFHRAVRLAASAVAAGWSYDGLREGVLSRGEPAERKVWTLRLSRDDGQRLMAFAPHATEGYRDGLAEQIGQRLAKLSGSALLVASGAGNAGLRDAAAAAGVQVLDEDADDAALLDTLAAITPTVREAKAESTARADAPKAEKGPAPPAVLAELLSGDATPSDEAIAEVVATFRRPHSALRVAERAEASLTLAPALLRAVAAADTGDRPIAEGTTLAVRAVAGGVDEARVAFTDEALAARFGGPGAETLAELAKVLVDDGWSLFRVLRGATRREREAHPMLETLADGLQGFWRLLIRKGETKGEVWFVAELPPEGRAAVPQLLLEDHHRAVVLPIEPDLLSWYATLGGPDAIGWSGDDEAEALRAAVGAWSA